MIAAFGRLGGTNASSAVALMHSDGRHGEEPLARPRPVRRGAENRRNQGREDAADGHRARPPGRAGHLDPVPWPA